MNVLFRPQLGEPHHHAYVVDDIEATVSRLVEQLGAGPLVVIENVPGLTEYLSSELGGVATTLHDASAALGHDIELHGDNAGLRDFFAMVKSAADGWDGSQPLRPLES